MHFPVYQLQFLVGRLPVRSLALFQEPASWISRHTLVLTTVLLSLIQAAIIMFLLVDRKGRQRARALVLDDIALERLVSELSIRLSGCQIDQVNAEIQSGLDRILAARGGDHLSWCVFSANHSTLQQKYSADRPGIAPWPSFVTEKAMPWCTAELLRGETITVSGSESLPSEAVSDRCYLSEHRVQFSGTCGVQSRRGGEGGAGVDISVLLDARVAGGSDRSTAGHWHNCGDCTGEEKSP